MLKSVRLIGFGLAAVSVAATGWFVVSEATKGRSLPDYQLTSLHQLTRLKRPDILENEFRQLLGRGAGVDDLDEHGRTPLFHAVFHDNVASVRFMLEKGADPNLCGSECDPPIVWASRGLKPANSPIVEALIEAGAEVNVSEPNRGKTPLHFAASTGNTEIVRLLIESGADVNALDSRDRNTPLQHAVARGRVEIADALLSAGAEPELRNDLGARPIDQLDVCPCPEAIQAVFRSHGADDRRRPELFEQFAVQDE